MIVRDFYFAAWAIQRGTGYTLKNGAVDLEVDATTLRNLKAEYQALKPYFGRVRGLVKALHQARKVKNP
jgi:hypothetical protein